MPGFAARRMYSSRSSPSSATSPDETFLDVAAAAAAVLGLLRPDGRHHAVFDCTAQEVDLAGSRTRDLAVLGADATQVLLGTVLGDEESTGDLRHIDARDVERQDLTLAAAELGFRKALIAVDHGQDLGRRGRVTARH